MASCQESLEMTSSEPLNAPDLPPVVSTPPTSTRVNCQLTNPAMFGRMISDPGLHTDLWNNEFGLVVVNLPSLGEDAETVLDHISKGISAKMSASPDVPPPVFMVMVQPPQTGMFQEWMKRTGMVEQQTRHIFNQVTKAGLPKTRTFKGLICNSFEVKLVRREEDKPGAVLSRFVRKHTNQSVKGTTVQELLTELAWSMPAIKRLYVAGKVQNAVRLEWFHLLQVFKGFSMADMTDDEGEDNAEGKKEIRDSECSLFLPRSAAPSACRGSVKLMGMVNNWPLTRLTPLKQSIEAFLKMTEAHQTAAVQGEANLQDEPFCQMQEVTWMTWVPVKNQEDISETCTFLRTQMLPSLSQAIQEIRKTERRKKRNREAKKEGNSGASQNKKPKKPAGITAPQQTSEAFNSFLFNHMRSDLKDLGVAEKDLESAEKLRLRGVARTDGVKLFFLYARQNDLFEGKNINKDEVLKGLLENHEGDSITTFEVQKQMNFHFPSKKDLEKSESENVRGGHKSV